MEFNLHFKAVHLLEKIANSVYERDPNNPNILCFTKAEVEVVEHWLADLIEELLK
jgi:hypothetical protein